MLYEAKCYARMAIGLYRLLRTPPVTDPLRLVREQLENREGRFLNALHKIVFADPKNPYYSMFRLAGCEYDDVATAVKQHGLEATLHTLYDQGIYLSQTEMKGKQPILRSGQHIPADISSFVNPTVSGYIEGCSSGSSGKPTRTRRSIPYKIYREAYSSIERKEFDLDRRVEVVLKPILPSMSGLGYCVRASRLGQRLERWFTVGGTVGDSGHYRAVTTSFVLLANAFGTRVPYPIYLPQNEFTPVAEYIARRCAEGTACVLRGNPSQVTRVAVAACDKRLDIRGTLCLTGGEAVTEAKRRVIEAAGAEVYPAYGAYEVGGIGRACRKMKAGNCVHLRLDALAAISRRRQAPFSDVIVDSLILTTLLPFSPLFLINVEMDDAGVIEPVECDCTFARFGFNYQLRNIMSIGKLTGQGMTLTGTDIVSILEEALPARIGGAPGDYQLVEREGEGQTQIVLRVSPKVSCTPTEVKALFLKELGRFVGGSLAARSWRHSEAVTVVIAEPFATESGKVHPLHLLGGA